MQDMAAQWTTTAYSTSFQNRQWYIKPWKIDMEPETHLLEKDNHLPSTFFFSGSKHWFWGWSWSHATFYHRNLPSHYIKWNTRNPSETCPVISALHLGEGQFLQEARWLQLGKLEIKLCGKLINVSTARGRKNGFHLTPSCMKHVFLDEFVATSCDVIFWKIADRSTLNSLW